MKLSVKAIFEYHTYIEFLRDLIAAQPNGGRGVQTALAAALGCQQAYLSKVLAGKADLNVDQAYCVCSYFGLNVTEMDYFIALLLMNRSYKADTKRYWQKKIQHILSSHHELKARLKQSVDLSFEDKATYYSDWTYAAVHVLTSIAEFRTANAIATRLGLEVQRTRSILAFLEKIGLVGKKGDEYSIGEKSIHLGAESPFIVNHHRNWRLKAIEHVNRSTENLNYSSVITCARADRYKIKEILIKAIEQIRIVVKNSKDDSIFSYGIDFLEL
jgi:uncharacterized protein (TIGR02147 family)